MTDTPHTYYFLDTCIYVACSIVNRERAQPQVLEDVLAGLRKTKSTLLLPEMVLGEYHRGIKPELAKLTKQLRAFRKGVTSEVLAAGNDRDRLTRAIDDIAKERRLAALHAERFVEKQLPKAPEVELVELSEEAISQAIMLAAYGSKPSKPNLGLLQGDCLIVASLSAFAGQLDEGDTLVFCSINTKDFATSEKRGNVHARHVLHPDIAKLFRCQTRFYSEPAELVEKEFQAPMRAAASADLSAALAGLGKPSTARFLPLTEVGTMSGMVRELQRNLALTGAAPSYSGTVKNLFAGNADFIRRMAAASVLFPPTAIAGAGDAEGEDSKDDDTDDEE